MAATERLRSAELSAKPARTALAQRSLAGRRILFVLPSLSVGGSERQAAALAVWLRDRHRAEVGVWGFGSAGAVAEELIAVGIPSRALALGWPRNRWMRIKGLLRFAAELRRWRPDAVLPYTVRPNVACGLAWRIAGARTCIWGQRDAGLDMRVERRWQRRAARRTPHYAANAEHGRTFLIDELAVPARRVEVIPNGVSLPPPRHQRTDWRQRLAIDDHTSVALMVANLHRNKDHETLLRAWHRVVSDLGPSRRAVLLLAGRHGDTEPAIRTQVHQLGLAEDIHLLGPVNDIAGLLSAADVFVYSSRQEGCPNAVLEAMAAGLPVAATDNPGVRTALGDDMPLAPAGDAAGLAAVVSRLLADAKHRRSLGAANLQRAAERFVPERSFERFAELLIDAVGQAPPRKSDDCAGGETGTA